MERIRPALSYLLVGTASALGLWAAFSLPHKSPPPVEKPQPVLVAMPPKTVPVQRPQVDVVFVVDTTGSMSSLISGAKKKIWELARYIAQGQPAPELRRWWWRYARACRQGSSRRGLSQQLGAREKHPQDGLSRW